MSFISNNKLPIIIGFVMLVGMPALIMVPNLGSLWRGPDKIIQDYWEAETARDYEHQFTLFSRLLRLRMLSRSSYVSYKQKEQARYAGPGTASEGEWGLEDLDILNQSDSASDIRTLVRLGTKSMEFGFSLILERGNWKIFDIKNPSDLAKKNTAARKKSVTSRSTAKAGAGTKETGPIEISQEVELKVVKSIPEDQKQKTSAGGAVKFTGGVKSAKQVVKGVLDAGHDAGLLDDAEYQQKTKTLGSLKNR